MNILHWHPSPMPRPSRLVDIVLYHDIPMKRGVERDSKNRSNYATSIYAVNPSCTVTVSKTFSETAFREVIDSIAPHRLSLLEIVNYNAELCWVSNTSALGNSSFFKP